jgi:hypothetical protein
MQISAKRATAKYRSGQIQSGQIQSEYPTMVKGLGDVGLTSALHVIFS